MIGDLRRLVGDLFKRRFHLRKLFATKPRKVFLIGCDGVAQVTMWFAAQYTNKIERFSTAYFSENGKPLSVT